ncbi:MAG: cell division protein SepF [Candidatus Aenigmarchaeota archaeon]|nr:cell division protein SepF [Candidatus Aenigmarchaeota archaeon]
MGLLDLFRKKKEEQPAPTVEEYHELEGEEEAPLVHVVVDKLDSLTAVDRIIKHVKSGNVVVAGMRELKETNLDELKQCVNKLKLSVTNMNGDIAGVGDDWLIVTPSRARIHRE